MEAQTSTANAGRASEPATGVVLNEIFLPSSSLQGSTGHRSIAASNSAADRGSCQVSLHSSPAHLHAAAGKIIVVTRPCFNDIAWFPPEPMVAILDAKQCPNNITLGVRAADSHMMRQDVAKLFCVSCRV